MEIKKIKGIDLKNEKRNLAIYLDDSSEIVCNILEVLGLDFNELKKDKVIVYPTFGKLGAEFIYLISRKAMKNDRNKVVNVLTKAKKDLVVIVESFGKLANVDEFAGELIENWMKEHYELSRFKETKKEQPSLNFTEGLKDAVLENHRIVGNAINNCCDLVNTPYNYMKAEDLALYAKKLSDIENVTVKIYNKKEILEMNMGSYLGVNAGSSDEPKLIYVHYKNSNDPVTALVGKGVMYDTGGYSLKTPTGMPGMKGDMAGSAAVITAIEAISKLKMKANVMAIVAATDNRIGDDAIVPDDILIAANGKSIEIISTDAEGRLTLADAVWFAQKQGAKRVIDVATLTGACVMALGPYYTGAFTNDEAFLAEFKTVTSKTKEKIWHMPISKEYHDELKSQVADMKNKGGRSGGASTAAAFIENFIEEGTAWIHLDIAGTSGYTKGPKRGTASGVMVKSFIELFK